MTVHGMQHETSVEIDAAPADVYALVSDVTRMGEWSPENVGADWTGGTPSTEGATFEGHNRIGEREWSVPCTVTVAQSPGVLRMGDQTAGSRRTICALDLSHGTECDTGGTTLTEVWDVLSLPPTLQPLSAANSWQHGRTLCVQAWPRRSPPSRPPPSPSLANDSGALG